MTSAWWAVTTAVFFGQFTIAWPMYRRDGYLTHGIAPLLAAVAQAVALLTRLADS